MPRIALALVVFATVGLASCLGYGNEETVALAIETVYTRADPTDCTHRLTQRAVEQSTFDRGELAQAVCRANREKALRVADSVSVSQVELHGNTAVAQVAIHGGLADGQRQTLRLVKVQSGWKIDRITALDIDRRRYNRALRRTVADFLGANRVACYLREFRRVSDSEIERAVVLSEPSVFMTPAWKCGWPKRRSKQSR